MTRAQRLEAALALAMLPVGVVFGIASALAAAAMLFFAAMMPFWTFADHVTWPFVIWCVAGGVAMVYATRASIEVVSAFDWRPLVRIVAVWAVTVVTSPLLPFVH